MSPSLSKFIIQLDIHLRYHYYAYYNNNNNNNNII